MVLLVLLLLSLASGVVVQPQTTPIVGLHGMRCEQQSGSMVQVSCILSFDSVVDCLNFSSSLETEISNAYFPPWPLPVGYWCGRAGELRTGPPSNVASLCADSRSALVLYLWAELPTDQNLCTFDSCGLLLPSPSIGSANFSGLAGANAYGNLCTGRAGCQISSCIAFFPSTPNGVLLGSQDPSWDVSCVAGTGCIPSDACHLVSRCTPGCTETPFVCSPLDACHSASCNATAGGCVQTLLPCAPRDACETATCDPLLGCVRVPNTCDPIDSCHLASCDPATGSCLQEPVACPSVGICQVGTCNVSTGNCSYKPVVCAPIDACHNAYCNPTTGLCVQAPVPCPSPADRCHNGNCDPSTGVCVYSPVVCNPIDACHSASCNLSTGACVQTPIVCRSNDPCLVGTCDASAGGCIFSSVACVPVDACHSATCNSSAGGCVQSPLSCDDGNGCTIDSCSPLQGCLHVRISCPDQHWRRQGNNQSEWSENLSPPSVCLSMGPSSHRCVRCASDSDCPSPSQNAHGCLSRWFCCKNRCVKAPKLCPANGWHHPSNSDNDALSDPDCKCDADCGCVWNAEREHDAPTSSFVSVCSSHACRRGKCFTECR